MEISQRREETLFDSQRQAVGARGKGLQGSWQVVSARLERSLSQVSEFEVCLPPRFRKHRCLCWFRLTLLLVAGQFFCSILSRYRRKWMAGTELLRSVREENRKHLKCVLRVRRSRPLPSSRVQSAANGDNLDPYRYPSKRQSLFLKEWGVMPSPCSPASLIVIRTPRAITMLTINKLQLKLQCL